MSEEKNVDPILKKVEILKENTVIKVELPVAIYYRLNQFLLELFPVKDNEEFLDLLQKVKDDKITEDRKAYHLSTLITLLVTLEDEARKQGGTEFVNINMETGEKTPIESPQ
jgi:hypothetical protein